MHTLVQVSLCATGLLLCITGDTTIATPSRSTVRRLDFKLEDLNQRDIVGALRELQPESTALGHDASSTKVGYEYAFTSVSAADSDGTVTQAILGGSPTANSTAFATAAHLERAVAVLTAAGIQVPKHVTMDHCPA